MKKLYCQYCGALLSDRCGCARELAEAEQERIEELESRPDTLYGWAQQDLIDLRKFER